MHGDSSMITSADSANEKIKRLTLKADGVEDL